MKKPTRKPEKFLMRIGQGTLEPGDGYTKSRLRAKGYHIGDEVLIQISKCRNPKFHRFVHQFATLLKENIEDFANMDSHSIIKRIQIEANIFCEEVSVKIPQLGYTIVRLPLSLSFDNMDEGEFEEFYKSLTRYVVQTYWPDLDEDRIQQMAQMMGDVA